MMIKKIIFLALCIGVLSCKKESTSWDSSWTAPLVKDTLSFKNWIDSGYISVNSDQSISLTLNRELFSLSVTDYINIPDTTVEQSFVIPVPSIFASAGSNFVNDVDEFTFELDDVELSKVIVSNGKAKLKIENPLEIPAIFNITLPGVEKDNIVFNQIETVPATINGVIGTKEFELDFSGYSIDLKGEDGNSFNKLQSIMQVSSDPNGESTQITNTDIFKFNFTLKDLKLAYARGYFGNLILEDTETVNVEKLANITEGSIDVENVEIDVTLENGIKVNAQAKINALNSVNMYQSNTVSITNSEIGVLKNINPATGSWNTLTPSVTNFSFTSDNSSIEQFIENLGSTYAIDYFIELNPLGNTSGGFDEIFPESKLTLNLNATMPIGVGVSGLNFVDTIEIDFEQDFDKTHITNGELIAKTQNTFPYSCQLTIQLLDQNYNLLTSISSTQFIEEAYSISASNVVLPIKNNELKYVLNTEDTKVLNSTKYIVYTATLDASNTAIQTVYADSKLIIDLYSNFDVEANF